MTDREAQNIIRQRSHPRLTDFCYLTTRAHLRAFRRFLHLLKREGRTLELIDVGCGQKPFAPLLKDASVGKYIGVDFDTGRSQADVVAPADALPFPENSFDVGIGTEVYEHTPHLDKAIAELRRVARNGALIYISTPFLFPEHGVPYDFQRITRYKYEQLFKDDEILLLQGTNVSLATPFFLWNVVWENLSLLRMIPILTPLVYLWNNLWALLATAFVHLLGFLGRTLLRNRQQWFTTIFQTYFQAMPGGYDVIVRIRK